MESPHDHLTAGRLDAALAAARDVVKAKPSDLEARWLLAELLVLGGELERADQQLDTLMNLEPRASVTAVPLRQLIRAETARREFFSAGRVPELLDGVDAGLKARLEAFVLAREGDRAGAGRVVEEAERNRPPVAGTLDGRAFTDFRDLDDITAEVFEVLTHTGKYYWIPMARVERIDFAPPERPLDLLWRKARMVVRDAFDAEVHLPAIYGSVAEADDASRLGRRTDWLGAEGEVIVGVGRRTFVSDIDDTIDMMAVTTLTFAGSGQS